MSVVVVCGLMLPRTRKDILRMHAERFSRLAIASELELSWAGVSEVIAAEEHRAVKDCSTCGSHRDVPGGHLVCDDSGKLVAPQHSC